MYEVVACGVNQAPGAARLRFAEKDANDVAVLFTSGLGPVGDDDVQALLGHEASGHNIDEALLSCYDNDPEYLLFYFSGHGSHDGILASNGLYPYRRLIEQLEFIDAPHQMVILDVCSAASYVSFLKEAYDAEIGGLYTLSWLDALANATPGTRLIFSTGADRAAREGGQTVDREAVSNGHFTHSLIRALRRCSGDLEGTDCSWVSDQRAFAAARYLMRTELATAQDPVERGLTGDFPLIMSQAEHVVGYGHFSRTRILGGGLAVRFTISERRYVPTILGFCVLNSSGAVIHRQRMRLTPQRDASSFTRVVKCPREAILRDGTCRIELIRYGTAHLEWILQLKDEDDVVLDDKVVSTRYFRRRRPSTW